MSDVKHIRSALMAVLILLLSSVIFSYLIQNDFLPYNDYVYFIVKAFRGFYEKDFFSRLFYSIVLYCFVFLVPSFTLGRNMTKQKKIRYSVISLSLTALFLLGYFNVFIYDAFIFPLYIILNIPFAALMAASMRRRPLDSDFFEHISCLPSTDNFYFELNTEKGLMRLHKAEENIYIDGGPGSGKSHYLIKHFIFQAALRQYGGFLYDYEGDPTKEGSPILSTIAYSSLSYASTIIPDYNLRFAFINFTDLSRTVRVNVLSRRYYTDSNAKLFINNLATTLMKNLEPSWKEKSDFWSGNAINFVSSVMYKLFKSHSKEGCNTLPHAVSVCLSNSDTVFRWLKDDPEIAKTMSPMITAWELGAQQQTAGAVSSAQLPLSLIYNKEIYWVLGKDEFDLDITNRENPTLLCIGNCPELKDSISPAISSIISVILTQMNNPGKCKSIFMVDELPTINIYGLDRFMSTARKHYVSSIIAIQDYQQLTRDYGDKSASTIKATCGTRFQGKTGNDKTCEEVVKALGDIHRTKISYTDNSTGGGSVSESQQREKILEPRDIMAQESGHFFGLISNGKPPHFFTSFQPFHAVSEYKKKNIPPFSLKYKTDNSQIDSIILENLIHENFKRIESDVEKLLAPHIKKADE